MMNSEQGTMGSVLGNGRRALAEEVPVGYKRTEVGVIPEEWNAVLLGDLFVFKNGLNKAKRFFGYGTPIVNYMDVFEHPGIRMKDLSGRVNLSPEEIKNFEVRLGDVFFTRTSETVEEIGVASVMLDEPCDTVFSGFVLRARPRNDQLDDHYKQYCFDSRAIRDQIVSNATYTTRALTNGRSLSAVWIAVPPKHEQRAIAEALSDVDGLLATLEVLIAKKRAVKQAAMQQLLTGKSRLPGFSGTWETKRLGEFASIRNYKVLPSNVPIDTPCVELDHIGQGNGRLLGCSTAQHSTSSKYRFFSGDVLFGRLRSYLRKFWLADRDGICTTEIWPLVTDPQQADSGFLHAIVQCDQFIEAASISYGTHMPRTDWNVMRNFEICLPQVQEQRAIAAVLSDMDAEIAALERRRDKTRAVKQSMMQQLLTGRVRLIKLTRTMEASV